MGEDNVFWSIIGGTVAIVGRVLSNKELRRLTSSVLITWLKVFFGRYVFSHAIFTNQKYTRYLITVLHFEDSWKGEVFRELLTVKNDIVLEYLVKWVKENNKNFKSFSRLELLNSMQTILNLIIKGNSKEILGYERAIKNNFVYLYGDVVGLKVYKLVYSGGFHPYHKKNIKFIDCFFKNIFFYEKMDNLELVNMFLDKVNTALSIAVDDLLETFNNFNGSFTEIKTEFEGKKRG